MPNKDDMLWFKTNFHTQIEPALAGTPFTLDLITAIACQESGEIWPTLRKKNLPISTILELCVGDTIDARSVFPRSRAELESRPNGAQMFAIARQALVDMAEHIAGFRNVAKNPNKFCHGYGIFQFDIQHFPNEPDYFLQKQYADFDQCLRHALRILQSARVGIGFKNKPTLNDRELAFCAIAYNVGPGNFKASRGLKQGHQSPDGKFYGENIFNFLTISKTVKLPEAASAITPAVQPVS